jgi:hypothetical protein
LEEKDSVRNNAENNTAAGVWFKHAQALGSVPSTENKKKRNQKQPCKTYFRGKSLK